MGKKPGSTASSFTKSTRYSVPSAVPLPNEATEDEASVTTNAASASPPATRNSRCYAYVSIPSQPPKSETKAALNVTPVVRRKKKVSFLPAKRRSAATTPESEDTRTQDLQRVDQLQHKLDAIQSSKASEIKAIREAVRKEKLQLDDLVRESTLRATFDDEKLRANRCILERLKIENDKIRATNQVMAMNNRSLRLNAERLNESLQNTTQLHEKLNVYHKKEAQTQDKLEKKCRQLELSIEWLQYQVAESTEYARRQSMHKDAYAGALVALIPHLAVSGHPDLAHQVRNLYESAIGAVNVDQDWTKSEVDTCAGTLSSTDMESESELELFALY
jgi:hypothetical protein